MDKTKVTEDLDNKRLIIERSFDASQQMLWNAYADKDLFEKWWGPEGWETTVKEFDLSPGGKIHYGMKCVDPEQGEWFGQVSWGMMIIDQVNAPNSFSYKDYFTDEAGNLNQEMPSLSIVNEFIEEDGKARLVSTSSADSAEQIEQLIKMGMLEGFNSQLNKLDALFAGL